MEKEYRIPLAGTTIQFDTASHRMLITTGTHREVEEGQRKPVSADEWWETFMQGPFTLGAGPWHFAKGSITAKLSSGADVTAEAAEMEFGLAKEPLLDALRFAIETDIPTFKVFRRINKGAREITSRGVNWANLYADAVKAEYNRLKEEMATEVSASH